MKKGCFKRCIGSSLYDDLLILEGMDRRYRDVIDDLMALRCTGCRNTETGEVEKECHGVPVILD